MNFCILYCMHLIYYGLFMESECYAVWQYVLKTNPLWFRWWHALSFLLVVPYSAFRSTMFCFHSSCYGLGPSLHVFKGTLVYSHFSQSIVDRRFVYKFSSCGNVIQPIQYSSAEHCGTGTGLHLQVDIEIAILHRCCTDIGIQTVVHSGVNARAGLAKLA